MNFKKTKKTRKAKKHPITDEELDKLFYETIEQSKPHRIIGEKIKTIRDLELIENSFKYQNSVKSWDVFIDIFKFWLTASAGFLGWLIISGDSEIIITVIITLILTLTLIILLIFRYLIIKRYCKNMESIVLETMKTIFLEIKNLQAEAKYLNARSGSRKTPGKTKKRIK